MLTCFPTPYPDELLYSILSRYHIRSGNTSPKITLLELFGSNSKSAVIDMPCGINSLIANLPSSFNYTAEYLIKNHTMFPYYTAFLSREKTYLIYESMISNFGGNIHTRAGIMASSISIPKFLRFCPKCNEENLINFGEYYWNRLHQVPGVLICYKHRILLQNSSISTVKSNKHEYITPSDENCITKPQVMNIDSIDMEKHVLFSEDIKWLFINYELIKSKTNLREIYLALLKNKGLATTNGRVYQKYFVDSFTQYYGEKFLQLVQSNIDYDFQNNWLSSIVRKHKKSFHPLRHLLLIRYLNGPMESFFAKDQSYYPFGSGPWPCLNAAADHYLKKEIEKVVITHCTDTKLPVGTFSCSCGFIYSRRGPDTSCEDLFKIGRIKAFGPVWENKLKILIGTKNLSLRAAARELKVDTNTVKRYSNILGIKETSNSNFDKEPLIKESNDINTDNKDNFLEVRDKKRYSWIDLIEKNTLLSVTEIKNKDKGLYSWLYKNDRDWLKKNQPNYTYRKYINNRIDWNKRDTDILKEIKKALKEIQDSKFKPQRITVSLLGKKIGQLSLIEKHISKMPLTQEYLNNIIESTLDFQIRRIKRAAKVIEEQGEELKAWKIFRLAGIKSKDNDKFQDLLIDILSKESYINEYYKGGK